MFNSSKLQLECEYIRVRQLATLFLKTPAAAIFVPSSFSSTLSGLRVRGKGTNSSVPSAPAPAEEVGMLCYQGGKIAELECHQRLYAHAQISPLLPMCDVTITPFSRVPGRYPGIAEGLL